MIKILTASTNFMRLVSVAALIAEKNNQNVKTSTAQIFWKNALFHQTSFKYFLLLHREKSVLHAAKSVILELCLHKKYCLHKNTSF